MCITENSLYAIDLAVGLENKIVKFPDDALLGVVKSSKMRYQVADGLNCDLEWI